MPDECEPLEELELLDELLDELEPLDEPLDELDELELDELELLDELLDEWLELRRPKFGDTITAGGGYGGVSVTGTSGAEPLDQLR